MTSETTQIVATGEISGTAYTYGSASNGIATTDNFQYLLEKDEFDYATSPITSERCVQLALLVLLRPVQLSFG
jgi:hypothetical protein